MSKPSIEIGDDGVRMYQALVTRKGLQACKIGLRLNRAYTSTNLLRMAENFTGNKYGRGLKAMDQAIADLTLVIDAAYERANQPWADPMPETSMPEHP